MSRMNQELSIRSALVGLALMGTMACDVTGPDEPNGDGAAVDITGIWQFESTVFQGEYLDGGVGTTITAVLELEQDGAAISGTHRDGTVRKSQCWYLDGCNLSTTSVPAGTVQGTVHGSTVVLTFNADGEGQIDRHEGTLKGDSIQGEKWSAVRSAGSDDEADGGDASSVPNAPTNLQAAVVETASRPVVDLTWTDNSTDEDGFLIGESCDGADWAGVGRTGPDAAGARIDGPFPGTACSYIVVAFRVEGDDPVFSEFSNIATVTIPSGLTVTGLSPAAGPVGTEITIHGEDFTAPGGSLTVSVGGHSATEFIRSVSDHAITLLMPNAGAAGSHQVTVSVGSMTSNPLTWTQQGAGDPDDPANNDPATAPPLSFPVDRVGSFGGGDTYDIYAFTLESEATIEIVLDWNRPKDLDVFVADTAVENALCGAEGATHSKPERITCSLPAGEYRLLIEDYDARQSGDGSLVSYRILASRQ